jgi:hypothetical protein
MKRIKIILSVALVCGLAACEKPAPENPPMPKAPANTTVDAPAAIAVSTSAPEREYNLVGWGGNHIKTTIRNLGRAKAAVKVYEKSEAESMTLDEGK